ncbi:hypothetical protein HF995_02570 [Sanguibacter hominis ATCC BAA-789]|uniref:Uncharacterized protein n=1 Tax=Sanguibacter hominis ATCC BAA-789 TaxID=1312740 RepID=A0A9X5IQ14_9MICO|nr:hypothetical protein [Sanguibacter hominis ATCC BAA-789]
MPDTLLCEALVGAFDAVVPGLVRGDRDELTGHRPALGGVQIEPATTDGRDPHRVLLNEVDEVFEFAGLPVEAVDVPDDDVRHPGPHLRDQRVVSVPPAPIDRGDVVVDEHLRIGEPEFRGVGEAVFLLALDAGLQAGAILRDPQIHCRLLRHHTSTSLSQGRRAAISMALTCVVMLGEDRCR